VSTMHLTNTIKSSFLLAKSCYVTSFPSQSMEISSLSVVLVNLLFQ